MSRPKLNARNTLFLFAIFGFSSGAQGHEDSMSSLLLALTILLPVAKLAGLAMEKLGQPAVLGELMVGMVLGNLSLVGCSGS